jgi:hypothetical protein
MPFCMDAPSGTIVAAWVEPERESVRSSPGLEGHSLRKMPEEGPTPSDAFPPRLEPDGKHFPYGGTKVPP